ncbi:MAG: DUF2793 domain-containing protein [Paracoccaceae bacterium]
MTPHDDRSPILGLDYILAGQAQKHVTHNEALRVLDVLVQMSVTSRTVATPPPAPAAGARHIVPDGATGAWAGRAGEVAAFDGGAWAFHAPAPGWSTWVEDEDARATWNGAEWVAAAAAGGGGADLSAIAGLGVNATPTATERLTVAADATRLGHDGADHRVIVDKAAASGTASVVLQTGASARAELGLAGSDDLTVKVSPDGAGWSDALRVPAATAVPEFPQGLTIGGHRAVESGSNANGDWTCFADGTMIVTRADFTIQAANIAFIHGIWTFPRPFVAPPRHASINVPMYLSQWSNPAPRMAISLTGALTPPDATTAMLGCLHMNGATTVTVTQCSCFAVGRWY